MEYELYHHGILGMKWGIRRFQNADGSLTPAGRKRLQKNAKNVEDARRKYEKAGFLKRGKARENYEKAREKYAKFASKLEYAKMSDAELLNASHEFVKNQNSQALRSQNVEGGANALAERIRLLSSAVNVASASVQLFGQVRKEFNLGKVNKQQYELNERKQALEERKVKLDERKATLDYAKNRENNIHDTWRISEANKIARERADIDRQKNYLDYRKNRENNSLDAWKTYEANKVSWNDYKLGVRKDQTERWMAKNGYKYNQKDGKKKNK